MFLNYAATQKKFPMVVQLLREASHIPTHIWLTIAYLKQTPQLSSTNLNYDKYWEHRGYHSFQPRYELIAQIIQSGASVLDVGCGEGLLLQYLRDKLAVKGLGIDISREAAKLAKTRGVEVIIGDILTLELAKKYDYIILSEIVEHIANPEQVVTKLKNQFTKGLIISIPNIGYYQHRLRLLLGSFPVQWNIHPSEHLRYWTVTDFENWLDQLGLIKMQTRASNGFPILYRYLPNLFGNQVLFYVTHPT
ncbi:MAG TPA: methionine biosynthesis protein MetW [Anaerolineae bacterium]|nr:methionine biosynthesis protein MetW [Anaerolineae bacterium]